MDHKEHVTVLIQEKATDYFSKNNKFPDFVYLGRIEFEELRIWLCDMSFYFNGTQPKEDCKTMKFHSSTVFMIDDDYHIGVS